MSTVEYPTGTDVNCWTCFVRVSKTHSKCISLWNVPNVFNDVFRHSWVIITDSHTIRREALRITPKYLKCKLQDRQWMHNATLRRVRITTVAEKHVTKILKCFTISAAPCITKVEVSNWVKYSVWQKRTDTTEWGTVYCRSGQALQSEV